MNFLEFYDERFYSLVLLNGRLERLYTGGLWLEGPVWFADGQFLLFSDIPNNRILQWMDGCPVRIFRQPSYFANGHTRDMQGRLISCEHQRRCISRTEYDGSLTILADSYKGRRLNSPNDVAVSKDGAIWFTDPPYGILSDYEGGKAESEQSGNYVYRLDPITSTLELAADDFDKPNGLAFSPDQKYLYISDTGLSHTKNGPHHIRRFEEHKGKLSNGKIFAEINSGVPDGFRIDTDGNIWTSCESGVLCLSPEGKELGKILIPEVVSNLCFGDRQRNRLFITASSSLYSIYVNARGTQVP